MSDLLALLDQLDEARAKATPGEWSSQENRVYARGYRVATVVPGGEPGAPEADTALIVAAVNALPKLTAAVRGVLALADELEGYTRHRGRPAEGSYDYGVNLAQADAADAIRAAITAALTPEPVQP